ncbi:uncharacterized protein C8R40DRAFT_1070287 [Lentinula edodes]|uniref:uncharacterized protein n=1 Tax=Lentinula edodes TaxID=5353 RepID=UPI001E8CE3D4|nr:uncharacterized protein C8R40DRAFT_1070287 [Lentinula edodes]KAH7874131.1 hypothetical protein C8R40DRAFT_1070287 [Lentinula edodes]
MASDFCSLKGDVAKAGTLSEKKKRGSIFFRVKKKTQSHLFLTESARRSNTTQMIAKIQDGTPPFKCLKHRRNRKLEVQMPGWKLPQREITSNRINVVLEHDEESRQEEDLWDMMHTQQRFFTVVTSLHADDVGSGRRGDVRNIRKREFAVAGSFSSSRLTITLYHPYLKPDNVKVTGFSQKIAAHMLFKTWSHKAKLTLTKKGTVIGSFFVANSAILYLLTVLHELRDLNADLQGWSVNELRVL